MSVDTPAIESFISASLEKMTPAPTPPHPYRINAKQYEISNAPFDMHNYAITFSYRLVCRLSSKIDRLQYGLLKTLRKKKMYGLDANFTFNGFSFLSFSQHLQIVRIT